MLFDMAMYSVEITFGKGDQLAIAMCDVEKLIASG